MNLMNERITWDEYFISIAELAAKRSTCLSRQVGAIIVKDNKIISTGYNGSPRNIAHCTDIGKCMRKERGIPSGERHELCRAVHAEQNAIIQAGCNLNGATIYCTTSPCCICAKMILNSGITRIVAKENYKDEFSEELLSESNFKFNLINIGEEVMCEWKLKDESIV